MKKHFTSFLLLFIYFIANSQNDYDYFASPGLVIGQGSDNYYHPGKGANYFDRFEIKDSLKFIYFKSVTSHFETKLIINGSKLYVNEINQYNLFFDLNWKIGDTIKTGTYSNSVLVGKSKIKLLNGTERDIYNFETFGYNFAGKTMNFVPGLGSITGGLFQGYSFEGGSYFICAKDVTGDLWIQPTQELNCNNTLLCIHPFVDFTYAIDDKNITFQNKSTFATSFKWDFGDSTSSTENSPVHTYQSKSCFKVTLSAVDQCPSSVVASKTLLVNGCSELAWKKANNIDSLYNMSRFKYNNLIEYIPTNFNILKSVDGGKTFFAIPSTSAGEKPRIITNMYWWDENRGIALCDHVNTTTDKRSVLVTSDGGLSWTSQAPNSYGVYNGAVGSNGRAFVASSVYLNTYHMTEDYGNTWKEVPLTQGDHHFSFFPISGDTVYTLSFTGFWDQAVYEMGKSYDNGKTWKFNKYSHGIYATKYFNSQIGFAMKNGSLYKTSNAGLTFTKIPLPFNLTQFALSSPSVGWLKDNNGLIYYTSDNFTTFIVTNCDEPNLNLPKFLNDSTAYTSMAGNFQKGTKAKGFDFILGQLGCSDDKDKDGDGFSKSKDCNDENALINPGVKEIPYNGVDDDCNLTTLDDDLDQDGFLLNEDCNDTIATINPIAIEVPYNGYDDDCNITTLENDLDQDGFLLNEDCNDTIATINPIAIEVPYNGYDDDCNLATLENDLDQDGFLLNEDCNDTNSTINPNAEEIPNNGIDEDCDGKDLITSVDDKIQANVFLYPNPVIEDFVSIKNNYAFSKYIITNAIGATIDNGLILDGQIPLKSMIPGLYTLSISDNEKKMIRFVLIKQ